MNHNLKLLARTLVALHMTLAALPVRSETTTNIYATDHFGGADDGVPFVSRKADFLGNYHLKLKQGLCDPLPEELPSHLDTNGNWGAVGSGFQLSLRFQQPEFRVGEPVIALIYLRNVSSPLEGVFVNTTTSPTARKNFSFELRQGETTNQWSWTRPPVREWVGNDGPSYLPLGIRRGTQHYFAVRVDEMFDVKKTGDYTIRATWPVRAGKLGGTLEFPEPATNMTYISSGFAKFRVVEKP